MWTGNPSKSDAKAKRSQVLPVFLIFFVLLALLRTAGDASVQGTAMASAWSQIVAVGLGASELFLVCGMTAVGLTVSLADLRGVGSRALLAGLAVAVSVCACSLTLTYLINSLSLK
jgi:uncharacterized membrane protein YadS